MIYEHTHASKLDGSTAMLVEYDPFVLMNENGDTWEDNPDDWEDLNA